MSEAEDLRAATREAHEAIKDLRAATRDALDVLAQVKIAAHRAVQEDISVAIREGLVEFHNSQMDAIDEATATVYARFASIGDVLMGEDRNTAKAGESIKQLVARWAEEGDSAPRLIPSEKDRR